MIGSLLDQKKAYLLVSGCLSSLGSAKRMYAVRPSEQRSWIEMCISEGQKYLGDDVLHGWTGSRRESRVLFFIFFSYRYDYFMLFYLFIRMVCATALRGIPEWAQQLIFERLFWIQVLTVSRLGNLVLTLDIRKSVVVRSPILSPVPVLVLFCNIYIYSTKKINRKKYWSKKIGVSHIEILLFWHQKQELAIFDN